MNSEETIDLLRKCRRSDIQSVSTRIGDLDNEVRWDLINKAVSLVDNDLMLFMHVPKTGGTTFGETLAEDQVAHVVSADAALHMFLHQIFSVLNARDEKKILVRAHHPLSLFLKIDPARVSDFFTAYRDPVDVHVSNINMIVRRFSSYLDDSGPESLNEGEREFCRGWEASLGGVPDLSPDGALGIARSDVYLERMGSVFTKFFNVDNWRELVLSGRLAVIDFRKFDDVFLALFGYEAPPERKNVSDSKVIRRSDLAGADMAKLVGVDGSICGFLSSNLSSPASFRTF